MTGLFNNKYYNQLFGGKKNVEDLEEVEEVEGSEDTRERLERIFGGEKEETDSRSEDTEATAERLERIFGGVKGKKGTGKPKAPKKTDEELMASGKFRDGGRTTDGRRIFVFKNGAEAVRDDSGRFVIITGAPEALAAYRARMGGVVPRKVHAPVSRASAQKAWSAYWNRKMTQAQRWNRTHDMVRVSPKTGKPMYTVNRATGKRQLSRKKGSKVLAVKRAMSRSLKFQKKSGLLLDETSPKGYLYLQKEKMLRDRTGAPLIRRKDGQVSVRRAGVARHMFEGVAPRVTGTFSKGKRPSAEALAGIAAWTDSRRGKRSPPRGPKHPGVRSATEVSAAQRIAARNATLSGKRSARATSRIAARPRLAKVKAEEELAFQ